jgi:hypothetical protein
MFETLKQHLGNGRLRSNKEAEISFREQLRFREPIAMEDLN